MISAKNPGTTPDHPRRQTALGDVVVERAVLHIGEHADDIGDQETEPHDQHRRALHVESAEPFEAGERETDPQQRNAERSGAQQVPKCVAQESADRPGPLERQQREAEEEADDERRDGAEPPAGVRAHTGTCGKVTRRSWNCARTG